MSATVSSSLSRRRTARGVLVSFAMVVASALLSSCLTPSFELGDPPEERNPSTGGSTSGGGSDATGSVPGSGGTPATGALGGMGGSSELIDHCENRVQDSDETDRDCGGLDCPPCENGRGCEINDDCQIDSCVNNVCQEAECTDEVKNQGETDVDCGGNNCGPCEVYDSCEEGPRDCVSKVCVSGTCQPASCEDGIINGSETDYDCGGSGECPRCEAGLSCRVDDDCRQPSEDYPSYASCVEGTCVLQCPPNQGDCNSQVRDGCETDLNTSLSHCGACSDVCDPDYAEGECIAGNCQIVPYSCLDGHQDCNGVADDGCEADLNSDPATCGSCDTACSDNNGTPSCSEGVCDIDCDDGFDNCNSDLLDGCEADLSQSTLHCGSCGTACIADTGYSPICTEESGCDQVACDQGTDCNGQTPCGGCDGDGVCDDLLSTVSNCGGCGITCTTANGTPTCLDNGDETYSCAIDSCTGSYADCNGNYYDGCETNTDTSKSRCGGCLADDTNAGSGENCADSVGTNHIAQTSCNGGNCAVTGCESGWADCDGAFSNGCETDIDNDADHCGGCSAGPTTQWDGGLSCDDQYENGTGICTGGECQFDACSAPWGDCNSDAELGPLGNGCETDTQDNETHCGACGNACMTPTGTSGNVCSGTSCVPSCETDYATCDGSGSNGCETNTQSAVSHCGACGNDCADAVGTDDVSSVTCSSGSCAVTGCESGYDDCNSTFSDGCETSLLSTATACGDCGNDCTTAEGSDGVSSTSCQSGGCVIASCTAPASDCNADFNDGCEIDTESNANHCGGCNDSANNPGSGIDCTTAVGYYSIESVSCGTGACQVASCTAGYADCNADFNDGCEIDITSDATRCGGCLPGDANSGTGETCADKTNASTTGCSGGACQYECDSGWIDQNGDLSSSSSDGCETRIIAIESESVAYGENTGSNGALTVSHDLMTDAGNHRLLLVGLICRASTAANCAMTTATYGTTQLTQLGTSPWGNASQAAIYYALDADLPASGTYTLTLENDHQGWGSLSAQIIEITGAEQDTFFADSGGEHVALACTGNSDISVGLAGLPAGSYLYALGGGYGGSDQTTTTTSVSSPLADSISDSYLNEILLGTGLSGSVSGDHTITFDLDGCYEPVAYAVGVRPESNY